MTQLSLFCFKVRIVNLLMPGFAFVILSTFAFDRAQAYSYGRDCDAALANVQAQCDSYNYSHHFTHCDVSSYQDPPLSNVTFEFYVGKVQGSIGTSQPLL